MGLDCGIFLKFWLLSSITTSGGNGIEMIEVHSGDTITRLQVSSILKRHDIKYDTSFQHRGYTFTLIDPPEGTAQILDREAPRLDFSIFMADRRNFGEPSPNSAWIGPSAKWVDLTRYQILGRISAPFPARKVLAVEHILQKDVRSFKYVSRPYLDSEDILQNGFEVVIETARGPKSFQIYDLHRKQMIIATDQSQMMGKELGSSK